MISSQYTRCSSCDGDGRLEYHESRYRNALLRPLKRSNKVGLGRLSLASNIRGGGVCEGVGPFSPSLEAEGHTGNRGGDNREGESETDGDGGAGDNRPGPAENVDDGRPEIPPVLPDDMSGSAVGRIRTERETPSSFRSQKRRRCSWVSSDDDESPCRSTDMEEEEDEEDKQEEEKEEDEGKRDTKRRRTLSDHEASVAASQARITGLEEKNKMLQRDVARVRDEVQVLIAAGANARRRLIRARRGNHIRDVVVSCLLACAGCFGFVFWVQAPERDYVQRRWMDLYGGLG